MSFQDHFSKQADIYLKARPTYPNELFGYLAGLAPNRNLCWDCATGNGQAAVSLSPLFKQIIATDGSPQQIANAMARPNIQYKVATAEESGIATGSVDLITVATAAHWFNHDAFYAEAQRVAAHKGVLAVWSYSEAIINPAINKLMEWFMYEYLHDYWPDGRWYVRNSYNTLPFPFKQIDTPKFVCRMHWDREHWLAYIKSWSAYNKYIAKHTDDPIDRLLPELDSLWQAGETKEIVWPLHLKCAILNP